MFSNNFWIFILNIIKIHFVEKKVQKNKKFKKKWVFKNIFYLIGFIFKI